MKKTQKMSKTNETMTEITPTTSTQTTMDKSISEQVAKQVSPMKKTQKMSKTNETMTEVTPTTSTQTTMDKSISEQVAKQVMVFNKGSENHGLLYEQQVMALLATRLTNDDEVVDFGMLTNPNSIAHYDDILLKVTYKDREPAMFAIQLKHTGKPLFFDNWKDKEEKKKGRKEKEKELKEQQHLNKPKEKLKISIREYYKSFKTIRDLVASANSDGSSNASLGHFLKSVKFENFYFCIFTNTTLDIDQTDLIRKCDISTNDNLKLLDTTESGNYYQLVAKHFPPKEFGEFPEKIYLFFGQPDYSDITDKLTLNNDKLSNFTRPMANHFYNLIAENRKIMTKLTIDGKELEVETCNPLNKTVFLQLCVQVILCHRVSYYMPKTNPIDDKYIKEWDRICSEYKFISIDVNRKDLLPLVASYYEYRIREYTKKELQHVLEGENHVSEEVPRNHQFTWDDCKLNCFQLDYYLRKALKRKEIKTTNLIDLLLEMWKRNEIPIIVEVSIVHIIKHLANTKYRFFIVKENDTLIECSNDLKPFDNLLHIKYGPAKDIFPNIMSMEISLQGRKPVSLQDIVRGNEKTLQLIRSSDLLGWIAKETEENKREIGEKLQERVENYIYRRFEDNSSILKEDDIVRNFKDYHLTIISNDAGMGKSTVLRSLVLNHDPSQYTIIYDLADCKDDLENPTSEIHGNPVWYFYKKMVTKRNSLVDGILQQHIDEKKLVVFIDSFDEILPVHQDTVLKIITKLLDSGTHVVVTSRTQAEELLLKFDNVKFKYVNLTSLESKDISEYLGRCAVPRNIWDQLPETFLSTPLHLHMLREIYTTDGKNQTEMNETILYKRFIDKKTLIFYEKKRIHDDCTRYTLRQVVNDILDTHYGIALVYLFGIQRVVDLNILTTEQWNEIVCKFENYKLSLGLVTTINPIKFTHKTFSEYLAAEYINKNPSKAIQLYRDIVTHPNLYQTYKFLHQMQLLSNKPDTIEAYIAQGNEEKITEILCSQNARIGKHDVWGMYPIHWAAASCYIISASKAQNIKPFKILELILKTTKDATTCNLNLKDDHLGWNWLNFLTGQESNNFYFYKKLIETLIFLRTNSDLKDCTSLTSTIQNNINTDYRDNDGCTLSQLAVRNCDKDMLEYLLTCETDFDYDYTDNFGRNLIHHACFGGKLEIVNMLLPCYKKGLFLYDKNKQNVLHHACSGCSKDIVQMLIDKLPTDEVDHVAAKDLEGRHIFHIACAGKKSDATALVKFLISSNRIMDLYDTDNNEWTALHHACNNANQDVAGQLLKLGFDVNKKTDDGSTPLHLACKSSNLDLINSLLDNKADINALDKRQRTPLQYACVHGNFDVVSLLLKQNCVHSNSDTEGKTALHDAAVGGNASIIKALIEKGMHPNTIDNKAQTPLHHACANGHYEASMFLLEKGANLSAVDALGQTCLHHASISGNTSVVNLLLNRTIQGGEDIQDRTGRTPLHYAAENNYVDVVIKLLNRWANGSEIDDVSKTPLHLACARGNLEIVKLLLDANVDPEQEDDKGYNALFYAFESGNVELCRYLIEKGMKPHYYNAYGHAATEFASDSDAMRDFVHEL